MDGNARAADPPAVSIVVATRDEPEGLKRCLDALQRQTHPCEILVADGGMDPAARILAGKLDIAWIENPERIAATGWNRGIAAASGEVVGIMSSHAIPAPDYVERCMDALARTGAWAVGGRIARRGNASRAQEAIARATSSPFGVGDALHNYASAPGPAETVFPGMWPRWVLDRVGSFDPELVRNQDDELSYRIRQAGGRIWYDPAIVVEYEPRSSLSRVFDQYRQYGFWKVRVFQKHPRAIRPRQLVPAAWVAFMTLGVAGAATGGALRWILVPSALGYAIFAAAGGLWLGGPRLGPRISASLFAIHAGYGVGMWHGLLATAVRVISRALSR